MASLKMTKPGDDKAPSTGTATYRRGSTSYRRASRVEADGGSFTQGAFHRRTQDHEAPPHATKKDMASYLKKLEQQFTITPQRMRMIVDAFIDTLERGLQTEGQMVPMIPTYVMGWPTGKEIGDYLAVDLGGTNLRVCQVTLGGEGKFEITQTKYKVTEEQKLDDGSKLFDFIAECLDSFVQDHYGDKAPSQERIDHGTLLRWTKGWGAPGVEGQDVVQLLETALKKFNVPIKVTALINDTVGTLIASHYVDPTTRMGIIFGTGCNAAYMEKCGNIPKLKALGLPDDLDMAINCEWGAFDSPGPNDEEEHGGQVLPRTPYDLKIDKESNKPGQQAFEKMIAGSYLGEIFRQVINEMIDEGVLFLGQNAYKIEKINAFDTAFLSLIESDVTDELLTVTGLFTHFFGLDTTIAERQFFKRLAQLIGTRSARLSACGIAAVATKMGYIDNGGCDGSLYQKYPNFPKRLHEALIDIFGDKGKGLVTFHAEDGSGVGAAIIAALTEKRKSEGVAAHV